MKIKCGCIAACLSSHDCLQMGNIRFVSAVSQFLTPVIECYSSDSIPLDTHREQIQAFARLCVSAHMRLCVHL